MTEERKCYNCAIDLICQGCNEDNSKWQPIAQEKKTMENKVIFESEEEAREIIKKYYPYPEGTPNFKNDLANEYIKNFKQDNLIRKTALEEAEEMYSKHVEYKGNLSDDDKNKTIDKMYLAIQELKSEITRGKK